MKVNAECEVGCKHVSPVGMTEDRGQDRTEKNRTEQGSHQGSTSQSNQGGVPQQHRN